MKFDLLIKGGRVMDPGQGLDQVLDVALSQGRMAEVAPDLDPAGAGQVMDAAGLMVTPGFIDLHAHAFIDAGNLGLMTDPLCAASGVTTLVDGGSAGAATFQGFKDFLIDRAETRILAFLHVSSIGLADVAVGESTYLDLHDPERAAEVAKSHPDLIKGIKVRQQKAVVGENGLAPLKLAKQAARLAGGLPVMVHVTDPPVPLAEILSLLDPADIVSHFLHGRGFGILDDQGRIRPEVRAARERGVIFDVAHGRNHVNFQVARAALAQGFWPDTISTDLTKAGRAGVVKDLPHVLSKFLNLGLPLSAVLACATTNPARILGLADRIGTLKPGASADVTILSLDEGDFTFEDCDGNQVKGGKRLLVRHSIRGGKARMV